MTNLRSDASGDDAFEGCSTREEAAGQNFDALDQDLLRLGDAVPINSGDPSRPRLQARRQIRNRRVGAGVIVAVAVGLGASQLVPSTDSVEIATLDSVSNAGEVTFSQRLVPGFVNSPMRVSVDEGGVIYALSTAPGQNSEDESSEYEFFMFSSEDGEEWEVTDQQGQRSYDFSERAGFLYRLSTTEGAVDDVGYEVGVSSDGGRTWIGRDVPFAIEARIGDGYSSDGSYIQTNLGVSDAGFLAVASLFTPTDEEWLIEALGYDGQNRSHELVIGESSISMVDFAACEALYVSEEPIPTTMPVATDSSAAIEVGVDPCEDPPVLIERTFESLGLEPDFGQPQVEGMWSDDGVNWERVVPPGGQISVEGSFFIATDWTGAGPVAYFSTDGRTWTDGTALDGWFWEYGEVDGQLISFEPVRSGPNGDFFSQVRVQTSADGVAWEEHIAFEAAEGESAWLSWAETGPLGAAFLIQTEAAPGELIYELHFSHDGVYWQTIQLESVPDGWFSWGFITGDSIGLTFHSSEPSDTGEQQLWTVLLTPER